MYSRDNIAIEILYGEELIEYDFGPGHSFRGDGYESFLIYDFKVRENHKMIKLKDMVSFFIPKTNVLAIARRFILCSNVVYFCISSLFFRRRFWKMLS